MGRHQIGPQEGTTYNKGSKQLGEGGCLSGSNFIASKGNIELQSLHLKTKRKKKKKDFTGKGRKKKEPENLEKEAFAPAGGGSRREKSRSAS